MKTNSVLQDVIPVQRQRDFKHPLEISRMVICTDDNKIYNVESYDEWRHEYKLVNTGHDKRRIAGALNVRPIEILHENLRACISIISKDGHINKARLTPLPPEPGGWPPRTHRRGAA